MKKLNKFWIMEKEDLKIREKFEKLTREDLIDTLCKYEEHFKNIENILEIKDKFNNIIIN